MDGDRKAAFVQAWIIVKAGGLTLPVRGVSFGNRQEALRRLARYNPADVRAVLVPEPSNPVDPAAVAVMVGVQGGRGLYRLGYVLAANTAAEVHSDDQFKPRPSGVREYPEPGFPCLKPWGEMGAGNNLPAYPPGLAVSDDSA
ncbi:hypothetical protein FACS189468_5050 [Spirochaetia bacterium]|nr:hypothetical protein FACS189468_5050 [Spirochaetia bacterium]